jgi:hypothetical protein
MAGPPGNSGALQANADGLQQIVLDHLKQGKPNTVVIGNTHCRQMDIISLLSRTGIALDPDNSLGRTKVWLRCSPGADTDIRVLAIFEHLFVHGYPQGEPTYATVEPAPEVIELFSFPDTSDLTQLPNILRYAQLEILEQTMRTIAGDLQGPLFDDVHAIPLEELKRQEDTTFNRSPPFVPNILMLNIVRPDTPSVSVMALPHILINPPHARDHVLIQPSKDLSMERINNPATTIILPLPIHEETGGCTALALATSPSKKYRKLIAIRVLAGSGPAINIDGSDTKHNWCISGGIIQYNRKDQGDCNRALATLTESLRGCEPLTGSDRFATGN